MSGIISINSCIKIIVICSSTKNNLPICPEEKRKSQYLWNINWGIQGFKQFCKVADIFLKAPDVTVFSAARRLGSAKGASYLGKVCGACRPGNFLNKTLRNAVSSASGTQELVSQARLEFTQILFRNKLKITIIKNKTNPSNIGISGHGMGNGRPPASKENPG